MKNLVCLLLLLFLSPAWAEEMATSAQTEMVMSPRPGLTSDIKGKLDGSAADQSGIKMLVKDTPIRVLKREQFKSRVTLRLRGKPETVSRNYSVVYAEVTDGPDAGAKGWIVERFVDDKGRAKTFLAQVREGTGPSAGATTVADGPDLGAVVSRGSGTLQITGKKMYAVSVSNNGNMPATGSFMVKIRVGSRTLKQERIRGLQPGYSQRFDVEVPEESVRRKEKLIVEIDPERVIQDSNRDNNLVEAKLY